jgi:hypothetical protein
MRAVGHGLMEWNACLGHTIAGSHVTSTCRTSPVFACYPGELIIWQQAGVHVRRLQRHFSSHRGSGAGAVASQHGGAQSQPPDRSDLYDVTSVSGTTSGFVHLHGQHPPHRQPQTCYNSLCGSACIQQPAPLRPHRRVAGPPPQPDLLPCCR